MTKNKSKLFSDKEMKEILAKFSKKELTKKILHIGIIKIENKTHSYTFFKGGEYVGDYLK